MERWKLGALACMAAALIAGASIGQEPTVAAKYSETTKASADQGSIDRVAEEIIKLRQAQIDRFEVERNQRERREIVAQEDAAYWGRANFFAVLAQTVLAAGALWAIFADLKQSRASSETQSRAFLTIHDIEYRKNHIHLPGYDLRLNLENQGATPAYVKRVFFIVGWRRQGVAEEIIDKIADGNRDTSFIVAAGAQFCVSAAMPSGFAISNIGGSTLRIIGIIEYLDIFGKRHTTNFKFYSTALEYSATKDILVARSSMDGNTAD